MCGIAGALAFKNTPWVEREEALRIGKNMALAMRSRGPDNQSVWFDEQNKIILSHARLPVIDPRDIANQPFLSEDKKYALVYNGEVYNFLDIRVELEGLGHCFRTNSDTEIVLKACQQWGVLAAAKKFTGMFAFAFWNYADKTLTLARDPIGIKPLFFGVQRGHFIFASTLNAIKKHPAFSSIIDVDALSIFLEASYVPAPLSIYSSIQKLMPGRILTISLDGSQREEKYWNSFEKAIGGLENTFNQKDDEILYRFESLLTESVKGCLLSDVPLGAFLSGGIDSSLIVAIAQSQSAQRLKTFTVGFNEAAFDESPFAKEVAKFLNTDHTEVFCSSKQAADFVPSLTDYYDEPFADSSQLPTLLLSQITRQSVTVALSGDGGDELFSGYDRYYWIDNMLGLDRKIPANLQKSFFLMSKYLRTTKFFHKIAPMLDKKTFLAVERLHHTLRLLTHKNDFSYQYRMNPMTVCGLKDAPLLSAETSVFPQWDNKNLHSSFENVGEWIEYIDQITYLPDDILQKVDRASMAFSLEARVPYLDHRIVEFSWRVPRHLKIQNNRGKILMRMALAKHIPEKLFERPKMGFSIPLGIWLKNELKDWAQSLIEYGIQDPGPFNPGGIRTLWHNYLTGNAEHTRTTVWNVLMFLQWKNETKATW